ncbi:AraC family transcriptional regulator [Burkholderia multivorans]|uniref:AraC family transcriptional regulator n=1 Tax=Burkholderia multivorans TaxID=87883 RepID=A0AB37AXY4_9BURK|nr:AraC family transcriptional regulator [Burkholderia multivorans]PRE50423.1 AraC family transcriptional regulator [Burkholderia multivorans]PRE50718.1 AraC family transcriptional regulator [Burkholderia multivorans]
MDILTDIVRLMTPQAIRWRTVEAHERWGLSVPSNPLPRFCLAVGGECWLLRPSSEPVLMREGDYTLMTGTSRYSLVSDLDVVPTLRRLSAGVGEDQYVRWEEGTGNSKLRLIGGYFQIGAEHVALLGGMLPDLLHVHAFDEEASRLSRVVELIGDEARCDLPGRDLVMSRLVEVMLLEALRRPLNDIGAGKAGWLSGMADPHIRVALQRIHADVARHWTVDLLARESGMSRAVFARRFVERVGVAPATYLSNWRIALAKDALLNTDRQIGDIALSIGYLSDSAFSTAFSRIVGTAPAAYRKTQRQHAVGT